MRALLALLPAGLPQTFLQANAPSTNDHEINVHQDPNDYFIPFCFDVGNCLEFDDPLVVRGNQAEESRRLELLVRVNLADPDRQFIPGNVRGAPQINTPSLRGVWTQANLLAPRARPHHRRGDPRAGPSGAAAGRVRLGDRRARQPRRARRAPRR